MTRPCAIGIQLPEVERRVQWPELLALGRLVEDAGFDSLWLGDHLLYDLPDGTARGPWEVFTSLAALATVTERIALGPLVASIGFHEPAMLAKMAATVDAISGGRLILGLGAGWNEREYRAFGFPYDHRVARFEEAFELIARLLAGETVDHSGSYYALERCAVDPPPSRPGGPPLMVGSVAPRMLGAALPRASMWNVWFSQYGNTPEGFGEVRTRVRARCEEVGRNPDEVEATAAVFVQTPLGSGRAMGSDSAPPVTGTHAEVADTLAALAAAGASHLQLVVDPIDAVGIEWVAGALSLLD